MDAAGGTKASFGLGGAVDGAAATLAMSAVMAAAARAGQLGEPPPRRIVRRARKHAGTWSWNASSRSHGAWAVLVHFAFGAGAGSLFESAYGRTRAPLPAPIAGAGFGVAVWLASYAGWVPALGLMPPPHRDRADRQAWMVVAHLVYGAVLGTLFGRRARAAGVPPRG